MLGQDGFLYLAQASSIFKIDKVTGAKTTFATVPTSLTATLGRMAADANALWVLGKGGGGETAKRVLRVSLADASVTTVVPTTAELADIRGIASAGAYLYLTKADNHALVRVTKAGGS